MKKPYIIPFALIILVIFACTIPTSFEIHGSPKIRLSANYNLSEMFAEMITGGFTSGIEGSEILPCTNTDIQTYIIYMDLFKGDLNISDFFPIPLNPPSGYSFPVPEDTVLIPYSDSPVTLPLAGIGEYIGNFEFSAVKSKVYASGSDISTIVSLELKIGISGEEIEEIEEEKINTNNNSPSGRENWGSEYTGRTEPAGGEEIKSLTTQLNRQENLDVYFSIFIEKDKMLESDWFDDSSIMIEIVLWVPLEFVAGEGGAVLMFPDNFWGEAGSDLFGREIAEENNSLTQIIKNMNLIIEMNRNPFEGATLVVSSTGNLEIVNGISGNSMNFMITEENMEKLNSVDYFPFVPKFTLNFAQYNRSTDTGGKLSFPRDFRLTTICLEAEIIYIYDTTTEDET